MILVIDACYEKDSLSFDEFVKPVVDSTGDGNDVMVKHSSEVNDSDIKGADKVIICGTALKDNAYMDRLDDFAWLKDIDKPVLGICAGMQIIGKAFGGNVEPNSEIGMQELKITNGDDILGNGALRVYELHNFSVSLPDGFVSLAGDKYPQAFRHIHKPIFGVLFHPEVRNREFIRNFVERT